ncbi:MAG: hypothetical protein U0521_31570, partial [Anaerolineae bacterium]
CGYACVNGAVYCNETCTFLESDPDNCGACGNVCPAGQSCLGGVCQDDDPGEGCGFPFILCGGGCVDPTTDPFNCGGCFNQCAPNEVCAGGFCQGFGGDGGW